MVILEKLGKFNLDRDVVSLISWIALYEWTSWVLFPTPLKLLLHMLYSQSLELKQSVLIWLFLCLVYFCYRYVLFWIIVLSCKFTFSYFLQVKGSSWFFLFPWFPLCVTKLGLNGVSLRKLVWYILVILQIKPLAEATIKIYLHKGDFPYAWHDFVSERMLKNSFIF